MPHGGLMTEKLTVKQERVFNFIKKYKEESGYPPTVREITENLGLSGPNSAKKFLDILERKGWIRKTAKSSRAIEILNEAKKVLPYMVPVVGSIQAGTPILAIENIEENIAIDPSLAGDKDTFFLKVRGNSMIDAHIMDGDLAMVRPQSTVEQGEIAAVLIGEEATIKYFFKEDGFIRLQPANPRMEPILINDHKEHVKIIGKITGIVRRMD
jgi:repressor LexA